jgi:type II secretory pathway component PulF
MPTFHYKAKKGPQDIVESTIQAKTKEEAISKISSLGYVPVRVVHSDKVADATASESKPGLRPRLTKRVKSRDITMFIEQLASLVRSKIPVFEAINILATQTDSPELKKIIATISAELKDGKTLSGSLSRYPHVFPQLLVNMVNAGESGGVLEETLNRLSQFRQEEEDLRARITSALAYPSFIIVVGVLTIFLLLTFGVPRLTFLFSDMDQALPLPTQILIAISDGIRHYWYWIALVGAGLFFLLKQQNIIKKNQLAVDRFKLRLPLLGNFLKEAMMARFARTFSTLLANGIPVFQALGITIPSLGNEVFKKELEAIKEDVISGSSFAQSMKKSRWFPSFTTNMIAISEKSGNMEEGLAEIAQFYEREVNKTMKIMTSLLEPVIILVMGVVVAFIVMAMILPIFEISVGMG